MTPFEIHYTFDDAGIGVLSAGLARTSPVALLPYEDELPVVKWRIRRNRISGMWVASKPGRWSAGFPTHRQAMAYVTQQIARTK